MIPDPRPEPAQLPAGTIRERRYHDVTVLALEGEHDVGTADELRGRLAGAGSDVVVDLSGCAFVDSTIVACLAAAHRARAEGSGALAVVVPPEAAPVVRRALDILHIDSLLAVAPDLATALEDARRKST